MLYRLTLLVLMAPSIGVSPQLATTNQPTHHTNYSTAYQEAQRSHKPLLVILNPSEESELVPIRVTDVGKTEQRRKLLERYVVVVVDTSTKYGEATNKIFDNKPLPHVTVIDRDQKFQVFRTSRKLQGQDWTKILETFQNGDSTASLNLDAQLPCPT